MCQVAAGGELGVGVALAWLGRRVHGHTCADV